MIIGLDTSAIGIKSTGTSRYIQCLQNELQKTNHTVIVFSSGNERYFPANNILNSFPVIKRGGIGRNIFRKYFLAKQMDKIKVDCGLFPNYLMPQNFNKPAAIIIHDLSFISHPQFYSRAFVLFYKNQLKQTLRKNPLVITISEYSKRCINKYLGINIDEIHLLQAYVEVRNNGKALNKNLQNGEQFLLYVGHLEPRKNITFMIKNFLEWKKETGSNYKLKLAGEVWTNAKEIHDLLKMFRENNAIDFLGYVTEEALHNLYSSASGLIHTSLMEGFGLPILEAMMYNLPILCSSGSGSEEISRPYSIIYSNESSKEFKSGMDKLIKLSEIGKQEYKIDYSPSLMSEQLDKILQLLERKRNGFRI